METKIREMETTFGVNKYKVVAACVLGVSFIFEIHPDHSIGANDKKDKDETKWLKVSEK